MNLVQPSDIASVQRKWKPYPTYRNSGVEWLREVPKNWEVRRLKYVARFNYGDSLAVETREDGEVEVFGSNGPVGLHSCSNTLGPALIIGRKGSFGKVNLSREPCFAIDTTYFIDARSTKANLKWLFYVLPLLGLDNISEDSAIPGLSRDFAHDQWMPSPPEREQSAIAAFLDRETAKIDALVKNKERLIELLQEKRAAIISQAVTKGLDPNVPMKDSGVEWLGKIPVHWEVKRIRNIAKSLQTGPFGSQLHSEDYAPGGIPVINPSHLRDGSIFPDVDCAVDEETWLRLRHHELYEGDIVFARRGEMGRCALVTRVEAGWLCGTGSLRIRPLDLIHPPFLNRFLSTSGVRDWLLLESVGATMDNLNTTILGRMPVLVSPVHEQRCISTFVDGEVIRINALIARIREGIEKLKEYRTALISAAVTGKIDVRAENGPKVVGD